MKSRKSWNLVAQELGQAWKPVLSSWRNCFPHGSPELSSLEAFSAVLLYPEDARPIGEPESQPFIFDYLDDFLEEHSDLGRCRDMAEHLLILGCEAALGACVKYARPQQYAIWYQWPAFAQKQAQRIWNTLARQTALAWLPNFKFVPGTYQPITNQYPPFDWVYAWVPFAVFEDDASLKQWSWFLANHLVPGGIACVAGPKNMGYFFQEQGLAVIYAEHGEALPTFIIHQAILQSSRLHPELMVWIVQQS